MPDRRLTPVTIDMTPDGEFRRLGPGPDAGLPPRGAGLAVKLGLSAAVVAALAGTVVVGALVLWIASLMVPVALIAGLVAYGAFRFQMRSGGPRR